ncbi:MAG: hypothetical protein IH973_04395 [Myxococcales bacterium]|nr:hypothetical protein [Myxococcales bacterium]
MIRFLVTFGVLNWICNWEPFIANVRDPYCKILAQSLAAMYSLTPLTPEFKGNALFVGFGDGFVVVTECDGLVLLVLFVAGVSAIPLQRTLRPYVWAGGFLALLVVINWLRLVLLSLTSFYRPAYFDLMHNYGTQGALILIVVLFFLAWLSLVDSGQGNEDTSAEQKLNSPA